MKNSSTLVILFMLANACGQPQHSAMQEAWDAGNDPANMGIDTLTQKYQYETIFNKLPLAADLPKKPWSDDYWATYQGGLTQRWAQKGDDLERYAYNIKPFAALTPEEIAVLSPAEKYDLYMGYDDYRMTLAERERTGTLKRIPGQTGYDSTLPSIPHWEGLCHAWAPATLAFDEPQAVTLKGQTGAMIPFSSSDINGLLIMFLHHTPSPRVSYLGERCEADLRSIQDKMDEIRNPEQDSPYISWTSKQRSEAIGKLTAELKELGERAECRDTNAGAFHLAMTNQIGLMKEGFVADVTRDAEVWNQPVYGYSVEINETKNGRSDDAAPETVKEVIVTTTMKYIVEVAFHAKRGEYDQKEAERQKEYKYRLELNKNDEVIGGKWLSYDRPDFLWKQETPKFEDHFAGVEKIYHAATAPDLK